MPWAPRRTKKLQNYRCWQEVLKLEGRKFIWRRWEVWIIQHLGAYKTASGQEEPGSPGTWQTGHPGCVCREWTAKVWDEVEMKRQKCPAPRSPRQLHKHLSDWNPPKGEQGGRQKKILRGSNLNVTELQTGTCQEVSELDWVYTEMTQLKTFCCVRNYIYCKKIRQFCTSECVTGKEKAISWALFTLFSSSGQGPSFHWGQAKGNGHSLRAPSRATAVGNGPAEATSRGRCIYAFRHSLTCSTIVFFVLHASKPGILDQAAKEKFGKPRTTTPDVPLSGQSPLKHFLGLPWGLSGKESACQFRRLWFDPWSRKIPRAVEQLSLCTTTVELLL